MTREGWKSIAITVDLWKRANRVAVREKRSVNAQVAVALEEWLKKNEEAKRG